MSIVKKHKNYLKYEVPDNFVTEYVGDTLNIYRSNGEGALTISFFDVIQPEIPLYQHVSNLATSFIRSNHIHLDKPLIVQHSKDHYVRLSETGQSQDQWLVRIWIIAKGKKIVFATYQCRTVTEEIPLIESIMESIHFLC